MDDLATKHCKACEGGVSPLPAQEIARYLENTKGWSASADGKAIMREFVFPNFAEAQFFVNLVGAIAEAEGHHPDIAFGWGYAAFALTTHAIGGLSESDFIIAAKINELEYGNE